MSNIQDLYNQKFGKLTVLKMVRRPEMSRPIFWQCLCECGQITISANQDLIKGKIVSCGCARRRDISGLRFGKLLVLEMVKLENRPGMHCKCICDCGNETVTQSGSLKYGRTTSCGCNTNQSGILKFKKENPNATPQDILQKRVMDNCKWVGECLEHQGDVMKSGYVGMSLDGKTRNAHRVAWIAFKGEIPLGKVVCHTCDNRKCCNVQHLFLGSHKENTEDMVEKGRDNWQTIRRFPLEIRNKVGELRESGKMYREIMVEMSLTMDQVKSLLQNYKRKKKLALKKQP